MFFTLQITCFSGVKITPDKNVICNEKNILGTPHHFLFLWEIYHFNAVKSCNHLSLLSPSLYPFCIVISLFPLFYIPLHSRRAPSLFSLSSISSACALFLSSSFLPFLPVSIAFSWPLMLSFLHFLCLRLSVRLAFFLSYLALLLVPFLSLVVISILHFPKFLLSRSHSPPHIFLLVCLASPTLAILS